MLIKLTTRCGMGCDHCMDDAKLVGDDISFETFKSAIDFANSYDVAILIITGGEPTDHPQFLEFMEYAVKNFKRITDKQLILATNGMFLSDEVKTKFIIGNKNFTVQISNDPDFYKIQLPTVTADNVSYFPKVNGLFPMGRWANHATTYRAPRCFNARSVINTFKNLSQTYLMLGMKGYVCTPGILIDGSITPGESRFCKPMGTIYDSHDTLTRNLLNFECDRCGLHKNLSNMELQAIGK